LVDTRIAFIKIRAGSAAAIAWRLAIALTRMSTNLMRRALAKRL
jgi:hypothetical protein